MAADDPTARLDDLIASLSAQVKEAELTADEDQREHEAAMEALAEANRKGDRGPQWRVLQERIDRGETTLEAIFSGEDTSKEAIAVTEHSRRNLRALSEQLDEEAAADPEAFDPRGEADAIKTDLERRVAAIKLSLGIK